ncbi:MAG: OmpA family protein [Alphaproteobacteria bacterium]|nr:OmpA family protein [Alphaproteobacteria bacterium]
MTKLLLRLSAVLALSLGASACSSVPGWVDPTTWMADSSSDSGQPPDLADIPAKPEASGADDQKQVADSLAADRAQATYSAEALRAGNEPSAPPPADAPAATVDPASADAPVADPAPAADVAPPTTSAAAADARASADVPTPTPANSVVTTAAPARAVSQSDADLGFKPSAAPPLDPSVAQYVPASLITRYKQTASLTPSNAASVPVVARDGTGSSLAAYSDANGDAPAAVVFFPGDGTSLSAGSRAKVRAVVRTFQARGGQGTIKVVGHSSSRTADMPLKQHLALILERSKARASAVAREIIREGIPADKVVVDAVGDSQPVYYESMPKGEEGNRRAEIFLQS